MQQLQQFQQQTKYNHYTITHLLFLLAVKNK